MIGPVARHIGRGCTQLFASCATQVLGTRTVAARAKGPEQLLGVEEGMAKACAGGENSA